MQYKYVNDKIVEILSEDGLEEAFWKNLFEAAKAGNLYWTRVKRTFFDENTKKHNSYWAIKLRIGD